MQVTSITPIRKIFARGTSGPVASQTGNNIAEPNALLRILLSCKKVIPPRLTSTIMALGAHAPRKTILCFQYAVYEPRRQAPKILMAISYSRTILEGLDGSAPLANWMFSTTENCAMFSSPASEPIPLLGT